MTEQEVRRYLRKMSEQDSQSAFREFYDMTYDRLFRTLNDKLKGAAIHTDIFGSDHCPVELTVEL